MIYVGTAGWSYKDWEGIFYPENLKRGEELSFLSEKFNIVEINSSFYRIPDEKMAYSWCKKVEKNPNFLFTLKAYNLWTHEEKFEEEEGIKMRGVLRVMKEEKRLGVFLFQFPYRFKFSKDFLKKILSFKNFFEDFPMGIEVRHNSFDNDEFYEFLKENKISFANIDQPLISQNIGPTCNFTFEPAYIRLHGRNYKNWFFAEESFQRYDYLYSEEELSPWVDFAIKLSKEGDTFVILNNHYKGKAIQNAFDFINLLKEKSFL